MVNTEDYILAKAIVKERVDEFNKNSSTFRVLWSYREGEQDGFFRLSIYYDDPFLSSGSCVLTPELIAQAVEPKVVVDDALRSIKAKMISRLNQIVERKEQGFI